MSMPPQKPLRIAVVLTWSTRSHVTPVFEALRWLVKHPTRPVEIYYVHSESTKTHASDYPFVKLIPCGFVRDPASREALVSKAIQSDANPDHAKLMCDLFTTFVDDYEVCALNYLTLFERERFDLVVCDFFDRAAMDAALESNTNFAISAPLGFHNVGSAWYVPNFLQPSPLKTWMSSSWTRVRALANMAPFIMHMNRVEKQMQQIMEKQLQFKKPFRPIAEIFQTRLIVAHNFIGLELARSLPPNIIPFGPIQDEATVPRLEPAMKTVLDAHAKANRRVVYIAFGSQVKLDACPTLYAKLVAGVDALLSKHSDCAVVWAAKVHLASELEPLQARSGERLSVPLWVNQRRVLMHPAVKVFLTHAGYASITEAIFGGTPLLTMPLFGDQPANAMAAEDAQIARQLDKATFTPQEMLAKLEELMDWDTTALSRLQQIARLNSETGPVLISNALVCAATVGVEHLLPPDLGIAWR